MAFYFPMIAGIATGSGITAARPGTAPEFRPLLGNAMTYRPARMRFGAFIAPFHPVEENPTLALERDMQLVQLLDTLDYDEAWMGEHHSAGYEMIASPELFMAAAAERT